MKLIRIGLAAVAAMAGSTANAAISLGSTGYTQNFDTLAATGTANALSIAGWVIAETGTSARVNQQYAADTGASNTGDTYSYGAAGSTDRALGALRSSTISTVFGASFSNAGASAINGLTIGYTGEEWRLGTANRADQLNFQYSTNATSIGDTAATWTSVAGLTFSTPNQTTTGAKDGNATGNFANLSATLSSLNIAQGQTFWVRFGDVDASGSDDGLAVDNFRLSAAFAPTAPVPEPGEWAMMAGGLGLVGAVVRRRRTKA